VFSILSALAGWLHFLSLAASTGAVLGRWSFLPPPSDRPSAQAQPPLVDRAARFGRFSTTVLLVSLALVFLRQLVEFHDPFAPWTDDLRFLLGSTTWGRTWMLAVATGSVARAGFTLAAGGKRAGWGLATGAVLALGAFPALTGHANAGELRALTLPADTLHVWAAGGWAGGLGLLLFLEHQERRVHGGSETVLARLVPRFSRLALGSAALLAVTGTFAAWMHVDGWGGLYSTGYGRLLLLKLGLVAGILALGALNWRRLGPLLGVEPGAAPVVRKAAAIELTLMALVLAVTAVLVRTSPLGS
jgi:putative copper export protein